MRFITKTKDQIIFDLNEGNYDGQTVGDLKQRLGGIPFVDLRPDEQRIQYDGVVLSNEMLLTDILGDKRHVFVLTKVNANYCGPDEDEGAVGGVPLPIPKRIVSDDDIPSIVPEIDFSSDDDGVTGEVFDEEMELPSDLQCYYLRSMQADEDVVNTIVAMGYNANEVRTALLASYNNPDRAIEYLVDGIPNSLHVPLGHSTPMTPSRTPPPSYTGSMCSGVSDVPTPPDPSSPVLSSITSDSVTFNETKKGTDIEGYDANDECEGDLAMASEQKRKLKNKYKRIAKAASWAASNTAIMSASSTEDLSNNTSNINASASAPSVDCTAVSANKPPLEIKMDIDEQDYTMNANAAAFTQTNNN